MSIKRGSTPTHIFKTSVDLREADVIYITYSQAGKTLVEKEKEDCEVSEDKIQVTLTQEETLSFNPIYEVKIQVRAKFIDDTAISSNIVCTDVGAILKNGVI